MKRCMLVAAALFDAHRTPPTIAVTRSEFGITIDEAAQITPGQFHRLHRLLPGVTS